MADEPAEEPVDRRRLHRAVPWTHPEAGAYSTADGMHAAVKVGDHKWKRGVKQPYHGADQYDYSGADTHRRLRDAQSGAEAAEAIVPRAKTMRTQFNDRRGL